MGRHAGWIALHAGIAGGADHILIPERTIDLGAVCAGLRRRRDAGKRFGIVVVAEGATLPAGHVTKDQDLDAFGHVKLGGIGEYLAKQIEKETGRGGTPTAFDRVLATRYGLLAAEMVERKEWGMMAAWRGGEFVAVPLADAVRDLRTVPAALYEEASRLFA
jgi:6-phosphofructokinase 1